MAHDASDGVNGAPRILTDLREAGEVVSRKTVAKLMRQNEIRGISPRPWTPVTTLPEANPHSIPDLVARRFDRGELNVVWTSDTTYLVTGQGWLYLCAVHEGCSRWVIGYAFADDLHTDVVESALRRAVTFRDADTTGTIFHADRGCQYTSAQLAEAAQDLGVRLSVGGPGCAAAITAVSTWIGSHLNYTSQLRDFAAYARQEGLTFTLYTRGSTTFSSALRAEIDAGRIVFDSTRLWP